MNGRLLPSAMAGPMPARLLVPHPSRQLGRSRRAATSLVRQRAPQPRRWHHRAAGWFATASNPRRSPHEAAVSAQKPLPRSRWALTTRTWVKGTRGRAVLFGSGRNDPAAALSQFLVLRRRTRKMAAKLQTGGRLPMNACPEVGASTLRFGSAQRIHIATDRRVQFLDQGQQLDFMCHFAGLP